MGLLNECLKQAGDAFDASHDRLTGLLNGQAFGERLKTEMSTLVRDDESGANAGTFSGVEAVSILAFDLDDFKQVNDTYGHIYGDVVLRCLAARFEQRAGELQRDGEGPLSILLSRSGGEEFLAALIGSVDRSRCNEVGDALRRCVSASPLPTDKEFAMCQRDGIGGGVRLPDEHERHVTVSVGGATATEWAEPGITKVVEDLRGNADVAMYRAKKCGKNTVIHFNDIRARYGRVLEFHPDTAVVAIDIGRRVGVAQGQEFLVFHPDFCGTRPFEFDDGRTRKHLGQYPRYSSWRLVVFDAQAEIAFCQVARPDDEGHEMPPIPPGAHLEAVPLGSIAHLLQERRDGIRPTPALASSKEIMTTLDAMCEKKQPIGVCVIGLFQDTTLAKERGSVFVNSCLAQLFRTLREAFPRTAAVGQIQSTQFAVVWSPETGGEVQTRAQTAICDAAAICGQDVAFSAGAYDSQMAAEADETTSLDDRHGLSFARYAAVVASAERQKVVVFTVQTAREVLYRSKRAGKYEEALKDYEELRKLGLTDALLENQATLCHLEMRGGDLEAALVIAETVVRLEPGDAILWANLALVRFELGNRLGADEAFRKAESVDEDFDVPEPYLRAHALSRYASYGSSRRDVRREGVIRELEKASAVLSPLDPTDEIRVALGELKSSGEGPDSAA